MTQRLTVREARNRLKPRMLQEELAERVGVDQTYISLIEAGKRVPSNEVRDRLADALGIAPSRLRFSEPEPAATVPGGSDRTGQKARRHRRSPKEAVA